MRRVEFQFELAGPPVGNAGIRLLFGMARALPNAFRRSAAPRLPGEQSWDAQRAGQNEAERRSDCEQAAGFMRGVENLLEGVDGE